VTIPQTNFNPPFNVTRASHLVFTARDLAASRDFYVEVMGLIVSDEQADTIWLRGVEERCHPQSHAQASLRPAAMRADRLPGVHR
jgi:catechol 2,3-dioxygenase